MKLQATYSSPALLGEREVYRVTIEGPSTNEMGTWICDYVKPLLLAMGYSQSSVDANIESE